jgi:fatty-acyl-CoA synthase
MPASSRQVAPTLVDAVLALEGDTKRGFVFVRPDGSERLRTFHDMGVEAARRAGALAAMGLRKGDRAVLVIPDGEEFVLSLLGAMFAGIVPVPVAPQVSSTNLGAYHERVAHIAASAGATALVVAAEAQPFLDGFLEKSHAPRTIVAVEDLAAHDRTMTPVVAPEDLALVQFTSGSTGRPKGVMVTHANLAANAEAFMIHGLRRDPSVDKGVSWLPLFHDMGLIGFVVGPLFTNVPCVLLPTATFARRPRLWLDKIHEHRGTITYAPSFAYALVGKRVKDKDLQGLDLSCLRVCGCGAEPIQADVLHEFAAALAPARFDARAFLPSYGMAEATLAITLAPLGEGVRVDRVDARALAAGRAVAPEPDAVAANVVDCGRAFPEHAIAVIDDAGERLGDRCVGHIVARGPSVSSAYCQRPELTARTFKAIAGDAAGDAPWLHTGDLGYTVGDRLFVCGRASDLVFMGGQKYHPSDIEWAVVEAADVRRGSVVAFGVPRLDKDDDASEEHLVVCCEGTSAEAAAIRVAASAVVAARFGLSVHEVVVVPLASLPRTSSGKPRRRDARASYLDGSLAGAPGDGGRGWHARASVWRVE